MKKGSLKGLRDQLHVYRFLSIFWIFLLSGTLTHAQTPVTGVVKDNSDKPLSGVSISLNGNGVGITDAEGKFRVSASATRILLFTATGYKPKEDRLGSET